VTGCRKFFINRAGPLALLLLFLLCLAISKYISIFSHTVLCDCVLTGAVVGARPPGHFLSGGEASFISSVHWSLRGFCREDNLERMKCTDCALYCTVQYSDRVHNTVLACWMGMAGERIGRRRGFIGIGGI
jgi:hypothetical protein